MLAAEAAPLIKVGGLGDVMGALPLALQELGHAPIVVIPHYGAIDDQRHQITLFNTIQVSWGGDRVPAHVARATVAGVTVYLISGGPMIRDRRVYGRSIEEDGPRYIFFALAAMQLAEHLGTPPDILHIHDYHPGLAIYWLAHQRGKNAFWDNTASVVTVHNLPFQGNHASMALALAGLPPASNGTLPPWARAGMLPLALTRANMINAVSPSYAREMLTEDFGAGLHEFLARRQEHLTGILNGLDYGRWNPEIDNCLPHNFNSDTITSRPENKYTLQQNFGLPVGDAPLLGIVSRLDHQKGFDLAVPALQQVLAHSPAQVIALGTGMSEIQDAFKQLEVNHPGRVKFANQFDTALARQIYGSSDIFLMPSRYEPCGLSQMIAMRYGSVPLVRATGGLRDTVIDMDADFSRGTGVVFEDYSVEAFVQTMLRALDRFTDRERWQAIQLRGMAARFSWEKSAQQYVEVYRQAQQDLQQQSARTTGYSPS